MLFGRFALAVLPFVGLTFASPLRKCDNVVDIVTTLQSSVAGPVASLNAANAAGSLTQDDASTYLTEIKDAITIASTAVQTASSKRSLIEARDDLSTVGAVLAEVISDLVKAIEGIAVDLEGLPLIGALIIDVDAGLNTLLLGIEAVLQGVIEILQGLLSGFSGLLETLGNGVLASTLGLR